MSRMRLVRRLLTSPVALGRRSLSSTSHFSTSSLSTSSPCPTSSSLSTSSSLPTSFSFSTSSSRSSISPEVSAFLDTSVTTCRNGERAPLLFSDEEYEGRLATLRAAMEEKQLDACIFTSIHNTAYFSNFVYCAMGRPYGLVVTGEGPGTTISSLVDGGQPYRRSFGGSNLVYTDWKKDNYLLAVKEALGQVEGRIGVELDHINVQTYRKLSSALAGSTLVDISPDMSTMRMVKSKEEIEVQRLGAAIADLGGAACRAAIGPGVAEWEVADAGVHAMKGAIAKEMGDRAEILDTWCWIPSGPVNTDSGHGATTSRRLAAGDGLIVNCFPMIQGYYCALERTMFVGHVDDASLRYWEANIEVHKRGLELIRPGVRCSDVANELNELVLSKGLLNLRTFGYGHSFGLVSYYYGREAGLELREDCHTVIQPGMVVSMEPMVTVPAGLPGAGGYREHDVLVVTEDGVDNITKFPMGPEHNIVPL